MNVSEWASRLGKHIDFGVYESRTMPLDWDALRLECTSYGMWLSDHDEQLRLVRLAPLTVSCGKVSVFSSAAHRELATHVAILLNCVASFKRAPHEVRVYLLPSALTRKFPSPDEPIQRSHVNGGFCIAGDITRIVLLREEECLKVALHELSHVYTRQTWPQDSENDIRKAFNVCAIGECDDPMYPFETVVELSALGLGTVLVALLTGSVERAAHVWNEEREWGLRQAGRIIHRWRGTQKASVLEYIVLRSVLMGPTPNWPLGDDDNISREMTRTALRHSRNLAPEVANAGDSLRFTCLLSEELARALRAHIRRSAG